MRYRFVWEFIKLTRPLFLMGGVILYLLGALAAVTDGAPLNIGRLITGQVLITAIQLMTHYTNEYYDQEGDRLNKARTWFSGGSGVLGQGLISPVVAQRAAAGVVVIALAALILAGVQVPVVLALGFLGLAAAWSYSGPPLYLSKSGWGELSASLVVAGMVPLVGYAMQTGGPIRSLIIVACIPLVLIHFAMLIAFQIPDQEADMAVGKRTLTVRIGAQRAARLHNLSLLAAFCVILGLSAYQWPGSQLALLALPLGVWQSIRIGYYIQGAPARFMGLTMGALGLFAMTATLWLAGLIIIWMRV